MRPRRTSRRSPAEEQQSGSDAAPISTHPTEEEEVTVERTPEKGEATDTSSSCSRRRRWRPTPTAYAKQGAGQLRPGVDHIEGTVKAVVGNFTHAYTLAEVGDKTEKFRREMTTPPHIEEDATEFEKFQAMALAQAKKVPVAAIEFYLDIRNTIENHVTGFTEPTSDKLLPDLLPEERGVFTLVLDLDETLVYSDWQRDRGWRTFKRPGVEAFVQHMAQFYEVVVYSDQQQML